MKQILIVLTIIGIAGCFGKKPTVKTGLEGKPMPSFSLLLMDSLTNLNTSSIPTGQPIVLFYFSPICPFCKAQTEELIKDIKHMKGIRLYLISNFPFELIKDYSKHYQLDKYANIIVGQDYNIYFSNYFKAEGVPYMAIYNGEKILKRVLMGKVGIDIIRDLAYE